jgi:hypothetical protein
MGARKELNGAHLTGSSFGAGLLGLLTGSVTVFLLSLGSLMAVELVSGNIRPRRRR